MQYHFNKQYFFVLFLCWIFYVSNGFAQTHALSYYLQIASANSPLLKDYQNQIELGRLDSLLIRAAHRPQILANGQLAIFPMINGYGYDEAITNGGNYSGIVTVSQPLFNKGILAPQYQQINLQNLSTLNNSKISRLDLNKNITTQYLTAYTDFQQLQINNEVYQLLADQQKILKQLTANGIYKQTDYLTFLTDLQTQEISVSQLQMQYRSDLSMLNYLSGINDTATVVLDEPSLTIMYKAAQDSSIFFRQYFLDSLRIENQRAQVNVLYKPAVSWFANAGLNASKLNEAYHDFGTSFGVNFSVPIYDEKQRKLKQEQLDIAEATRQNYASFYHRQYNQQVAMLLQQLQDANALVKKIQEKLKTLELLINVNKKLLSSGDVRITDYMLALNNYLTVKSSLNQAKISSYQIINQLNYWNH